MSSSPDRWLSTLDEHRHSLARGDAAVTNGAAPRLGPYFVGLMSFWRHQDRRVFAAARVALQVESALLVAVGFVCATHSEVGFGHRQSWLVIAACTVAAIVLQRCAKTIERGAELRDLCQNDLWRVSSLLVHQDEGTPFETWRRGRTLPETDATLGMVRAAIVVDLGIALTWSIAGLWSGLPSFVHLVAAVSHDVRLQVVTIVLTPLVLAQAFLTVEWAIDPFRRRAALAQWREDGDRASRSVDTSVPAANDGFAASSRAAS